jgi:conjugative transfer pilus assembly protein TraH
MFKKIVSIVVLTSFVFSSFASVDSDLNSFFNGLGYGSNVTAPHAYTAQQAGYYNGGSLFSRDAVRNAQIMHIDLPSFQSGCGGIDIFTGGFSFINSDQIVALSKSILSNAMAYAFHLALESTTPLIENVLKYTEQVANFANDTNINSCQAAENLVGGMWPKTRASQQQVCQDIGNSSGYFSDWAKARQGCSAQGSDYNNMMNKAQNDPNYSSMVVQNTNLAWHALQQNGFLQNDRELAEFFMSLSGTIIVGNPSQNQYQLLPSLASNQSLIKALLYGGQATIYQCDEPTQCLSPKTQTITISPDGALQQQVASMLQDMVSKIESDQPISQAEIGLLQSTSIPVYKILAVDAAASGGSSDLLNITSYSDAIATDVLYQYLQEAIQTIWQSSRVQSYPEDMTQKFQSEVDKAMRDVSTVQGSAYQQMQKSIALIQQSQALEQTIAGQMSQRLSGTLVWAGEVNQ